MRGCKMMMIGEMRNSRRAEAESDDTGIRPGTVQEMALEAMGCLRNLTFSHAGAVALVLGRSAEAPGGDRSKRCNGASQGSNAFRDIQSMLGDRRALGERRGVLDLLGNVLVGCGSACGDPLLHEAAAVVEYGGRVQFEALAV